jgi:hypothetical protein
LTSRSLPTQQLAPAEQAHNQPRCTPRGLLLLNRQRCAAVWRGCGAAALRLSALGRSALAARGGERAAQRAARGSARWAGGGRARGEAAGTGGTGRAGGRTRTSARGERGASALATRLRRAVAVCLSRPGRSAEGTLARRRRRTTSEKRRSGARRVERCWQRYGCQSSCATGAQHREEYCQACKCIELLDVALVSRARPAALCRLPCLAMSIADPPLLAVACGATRSAMRAPWRFRKRSRATRR